MMELKNMVADTYVLTVNDQKMLLTKKEIGELSVLLAQEITGERKFRDGD